jgi:MFS family permease
MDSFGEVYTQTILNILFVAFTISGIIAHFIGKIGVDRKIGYSGAFWFSFLLGPLIGILVVIASPKLTEENTKTTHIKSNAQKRGGFEIGIFQFIMLIVFIYCFFLLLLFMMNKG